MVSKILPGLAGVKCKLCDVSVSQSPFAILLNLFSEGGFLSLVILLAKKQQGHLF